jgi:hypothetical protein
MAGRAAAAQVYPEMLCEAIRRGVVKQKKFESSSRATTGKLSYLGLKSFGRHACDLQGSSADKVENLISTSMSEGTHRPTGDYPSHWIDYWHEEDRGDDHRGVRPQIGVTLLQKEMDGLAFKSGYEVAWDDVTNAELIPELVKKAREVEMGYFAKWGVYEYATHADQQRTMGKIIGVRWVDVNKGDSEEPEYRSRLVGREFNVGKDDALYAATPPLEALRLIISHAATYPDGGPQRVIMINDVRRAYFYAKITRDVYIELPKEDPKLRYQRRGQGLAGDVECTSRRDWI